MNVLKKYYEKYKEIILYIVFGVLTTIVSLGSFYIFATVLKIDVLVANIMSWICAVLFAYFTNSKWVFAKDTEKKNIKVRLREMALFFSGRLATLGIEEVILLVFVTLLHYNEMIVKTAAQVIVLISNYVISKLVVFKN